jgi:membrane protein YdbS with pleckstrin-like domain
VSETGHSATAWVYEGVWRILADIFRVPREPPSLPVAQGESVDTFRPAPGFLRYMKFWFWLALIPVDVAILVAWIAILIGKIWVGIVLAPIAFVLAVLPDVVVYVGIHLRYDTTWYLMSNRSLRIRRGIWLIQEVTITFENVQNVKVRQGPVQRHFGIASVIVETAGAGGDRERKGFQVSNEGLIEGIADAPRVRQVIMDRLGESRSAGLGDEEDRSGTGSEWTPQHIAVLREIRDDLAAVNT